MSTVKPQKFHAAKIPCLKVVRIYIYICIYIYIYSHFYIAVYTLDMTPCESFLLAKNGSSKLKQLALITFLLPNINIYIIYINKA